MSGVVLEDITAQVGHPAVGITATGSGIVRVTRTVRGESTPVRSVPPRAVLDGEDFWEDHEAPLGVPLTYTLIDVVTGTAMARAAITLTSDLAWLSDPLDWQSGISLDMRDAGDEMRPLLTAGSLDDAKWEAAGTTARVMGARLPVHLGSARLAVSSLSVVITTWDGVQADTLASLLEQAPVVLLRIPHDPVGALRGGGYVAADVEARRLTDEIVAWTLSGDEMRAPGRHVAISRYTYDDVRAVVGARTYDEVRAVQGGRTYSAVKRAPLDGLQ